MAPALEVIVVHPTRKGPTYHLARRRWDTGGFFPWCGRARRDLTEVSEVPEGATHCSKCWRWKRGSAVSLPVEAAG